MRQWIDLVEAKKPVARSSLQPQQVYDRILEGGKTAGQNQL